MDSTGLTPAAPQSSSPFYPGNPGNLNSISTVSGLVRLQQTIIGAADAIYPGGNPPLPLGTDTNPQITVITGDVSFSGTGQIGAGILLVEGVLSIKGNMNFDGAIFVVGKGEFDTDGTPAYGGQILVANIVNRPPCAWSDPSPCAGSPNPTILAVLKSAYGPTATQYPPDTPGSPIFNGAGGGGSGGVAYNSCKANMGNDRIPYKVLATREILY
jgi:hypothetical protein